MNLSLVKKVDFNGVECDFYQKEDESPEFYRTREQIGRALEYEHPRLARKRNTHFAHIRLALFQAVCGGVVTT